MNRPICITLPVIGLLTLVGCETPGPKPASGQQWDRTRAQVALQMADEQIRAGEFNRARALLAAHTETANPRIDLALARIDVEEGQYAAAAQRLAKLPPDQRQTPAWHTTAAIAHEGLGHWSDAASAYQTAFEEQPTATRLIAWLDTLVCAGRAPEARDVLETHRRQFPGDPDVAAAAARLYRRLNTPDLAIRELRAALLHAPESPTLRQQLAEALMAADRHADAIPVWHALIDDTPDSPRRHRYRTQLATCLLETDQLSEAMRIYRIMTLTSPDEPAPHVGLATTLLANHQPREALPHARRALELAPSDPNARLALACTYAHLAQPGQAADILANSGSDDPVVREYIARWRRLQSTRDN